MIATAIILAMMAMACSGGGGEEEEPQATGEAGAAAADCEELNMLYATVEANVDAVTSVLPQFEDETGIAINVDSQPYDALQQKVFAEFANQSDFYDIVIVDTPWMPALTNQVEPLLPYIQDESLNDLADVDPQDFIPAVFFDTAVYQQDEPHLRFSGDADSVDLEAIEAEGFNVFGLPIQANALTMAYRVDLFEDEQEQQAFEQEYGRALEVPTTFDEFREVAQFFTRPDENLYGTTLMAGPGEWATTDFKSFVASSGGNGHLVNDEFEITFDDPEAVEALTYYASLINEDGVTPPGTTNASWDDTSATFGQGLAAMSMNYHTMDLDENVDGEVAYAIIPSEADAEPGPHFGTWMLSVNSFSNQKECAYRAIAWLTSAETQMAMLEQQLHPTRSSVYEAAATDEDLITQFGNFYEVLGTSLATGVGRPRLTNYGEVSNAVAVAVNRVAGGAAEPGPALEQAAEEVRTLLRQAGYEVGDE